MRGVKHYGIKSNKRLLLEVLNTFDLSLKKITDDLEKYCRFDFKDRVIILVAKKKKA